MSEHYQMAKEYYENRLWKAERVQAAVGRWITQEEADEILSGAERMNRRDTISGG